MKGLNVIAFTFLTTLSAINCDTPANCTYDDIVGTWHFHETKRTFDRNIDCDKAGPSTREFEFHLLFPNIVSDEYGNKGEWTLNYNQGFSIEINYRKYFAFSDYVQNGSEVTSYCDKILPGWSHDILGNNWSCFVGRKQTALKPKVHFEEEFLKNGLSYYKSDYSFAKRINQYQKSWRATTYKMFEKYTHNDLYLMRGGPASKVHNPPSPVEATEEIKRIADSLPKSVDWRNMNGVNYLGPVRQQGSCGSCYSFASTAMIAARLRIASNKTVDVQLAPQDVVDCSRYSQGCNGGLPYLVAGKYAQDYGFVEEKCNPYVGKEKACKKSDCNRHYTAKFNYIGGFYGGCNEELMQISIAKHGPIAVAFFVYSDFQMYSGGIYHHTGLKGSKFNPFEELNHAVLIVGYGVDEPTGEKYWIVQNSWGDDWGEDGYFRIRRGNDECGIESLAVEATPIP